MTAEGPYDATSASERDLADGVRRIRKAVEVAFGRDLPPAEGLTPSKQCDIIVDAIYESTDAQRSHILRKVALWSLLFVLLLGAHGAWPLFGLYRLASAVESRNAALLSQLIDFP